MGIGLTGGIGAGKSTVSDYLRKKGYMIIDADEISRRLTRKDKETLNEIKDTFGEEIFFKDGTLNRKALGEMVFSDEDKKRELESIVTRRVIWLSLSEINKYKGRDCETIVFYDAPLLFECGLDGYTDENWVVDAEEEIRIKRVMERDNLSMEMIFNRINNQMPSGIKKIKADHIIDNSKDLNWLYYQIDILLDLLKK